jgi:hypothetical protein
MVIIVDDFEDERIEAELPSYFNAARQEPVPPPVCKLHSYKRQPVPSRDTLASFREDVIDTLISSMISERFDDKSAKPDSPSVGSWAGNGRYVRTSFYYSMGTQAKTNNTEAFVLCCLRSPAYVQKAQI